MWLTGRRQVRLRLLASGRSRSKKDASAKYGTQVAHLPWQEGGYYTQAGSDVGQTWDKRSICVGKTSERAVKVNMES